MDKKRTIAVISPDRGSGDTFTNVLNETLASYTGISKTAEIPPRVVNGELSLDVKKIASRLADEIIKRVQEGATLFTIACNTLSLRAFIEPAWEMVTADLSAADKSLRLVTTLEAINDYVQESYDHADKMILLGTKPLTKILSVELPSVPTFASEQFENSEQYMDLVQEIIWRVKAEQDSDISTAPVYDIPLDKGGQNKEMLLACMRELIAFLQERQKEEVILGCTELPVAFSWYEAQFPHSHELHLIDPAKLVALLIEREHAKVLQP